MPSDYIINTTDDQAAMLARIGVDSIDDILSEQVPADLRLTRPLSVPSGMAEMELSQHMHALAARNRSAADAVCFMGGGAYDHFIPSVVDALASRSEFYTAYTPYQAEASQGTLQVVYEYQTLMCQLTGMPISNASLYEGGTSVAEAALMALNITLRTGDVIIAESVHPEYRQVLATYLNNLDCKLVTLPTPDGFLNPDDLANAVNDNTVCVIAQSPNFFGHLEEMQAIGDAAHKVGALFIASFDPISMGLLVKPGDYDADIAVAEGQGLGVPLAYGGPYLGILTCRDEPTYLRKIPGRLVGETIDRNGQRCWVLTLQTREQHIRRDKATSNICTNQGLLALRSAITLAALGPQGLKETAELCLRKAHYAHTRLTAIDGVRATFDRPFFKEFTLSLPSDSALTLRKLLDRNILGGLSLGRWYPEWRNCISIAVTEQRTQTEIDDFAKALSECINY